MSDITSVIAKTTSLAGIEPLEKSGGTSPHRWFAAVVRRRLQEDVRGKRKRARAARSRRGTVADQAQAIVRRTSIKAALTGAAAGALSTAATMIVAEAPAVTGLAAIPLALAGVVGEMVLRTSLHVDMALDLADEFGVRVDSMDDGQLWHAYALIFGDTKREKGDETGASVVKSVLASDTEKARDDVGRAVLGETLLRDLVPFVAIVSSAASSFALTRRLGLLALRCARYRRAIDDAIDSTPDAAAHVELFVETIWHLSIADGPLTPEETLYVAHLLRKLAPPERARVTERLIQDESGLLARVGHDLPSSARAPFARLMEVALAAAFKPITAPQRAFLGRMEAALGADFHEGEIARMRDVFTKDGILVQANNAHMRT